MREKGIGGKSAGLKFSTGVKSIIACLASFAFSFITCGDSVEAAEAASGSQTIQLFTPETYAAGHWKAVQKKNAHKADIKFPADEKTPDGNKCVEVIFSGNDGPVSSPVLDEKGTWRSKSYDELTFRLAGNAEGRKIKVVANSSKGSSSWTIPLESDQWKEITVRQGTGFAKDGHADFNDIRSITLKQDPSSDQPMRFKIGGFELKETCNNLPIFQSSSLVIPFTDKADIKLDGTLDENLWKKALHIKDFFLIHSGKSPEEKSEVYLIADNENLYIGAKLFTKDSSKLVALKKNRDDQINFDDCFEILIDDALDTKTRRHFKLNPVGTIADYHYHFDQYRQEYTRDESWNPEWKHKSSLTGTEWDVEIAIPLKETEIKPDKPFCLQICRDNQKLQEYSCISPSENFITPESFGVAVISRGCGNSIEPSVLSMKKPGQMQLTVSKMTGKDYSLTLNIANVYSNPQTLILKSTAGASGTQCLDFDIASPVEGKYRVIISGECDGKVISPRTFNFIMNIPSELEYGDIKLNPSPKKMETLNGNFTFAPEIPLVIPADATERTRKTARHMRTELHLNLLGILPPILASNEIDGKQISLSLRKDVKKLPENFKNEINELPPEGYYLEVSPDKIEIIGADEAGLYYGVVTLIQFFRANLIKQQSPVTTCVRIIDWPDLYMRMVQHFPFPSLRTDKERGNDIDRLKCLIKNVIAGSKINHYCLQLRYEVELDKYAKFTDVPSMMKMDEWREIAEFAKEHFIEFIPMFESAYRGENFIKICPELQEPGYPRQINLLNEMWHDIIFSCYDDLLRYLKDTKYMLIRHDECWQKCDSTPADSLNGIPKWKIYADDIIKNNDFFRAKKIRPIIYADMLIKGHNGGYPLNISKALDLIPRDVILANWSLNVVKDANTEFHIKGFDVIDSFNGFGLVPQNDIPIIMGYATIFYNCYLETISTRKDSSQPKLTHGVLRGADYSWNLKCDSQMPLEEWRRRYLKNIMPLYLFPERKVQKWTSITPIDLSKYANYSTETWFGKPESAPILEKGKANYGFIPFDILSQDKNIVVPTAEKPEISIDLPDQKIRSLFFLEGSYMEKGKRILLKSRTKDYASGIPIGEIQIEYEDGPTQIQPLLMGYNINETCPVAETRFMYGVRHTHDIKAKNGDLACLYLLEWVNPHPGRNVKKIIWKSYNLEAVPVLFAVTSAK